MRAAVPSHRICETRQIAGRRGFKLCALYSFGSFWDITLTAKRGFSKPSCSLRRDSTGADSVSTAISGNCISTADDGHGKAI